MRLWLSLLVVTLMATAIIIWPSAEQPTKPSIEPEAPAQETPSVEPKIKKEAATISLQFPLNCILGEDCWTARYTFRGGKKRDFTCKSRTQIGHNGTDFTLRDLDQMQQGVAVLAAAAGTVKGVRNTEPDVSSHDKDLEEIKGKECGNGLVLEHAGGWTTQYCHMKQGSISAESGDYIEAGAKLGEVGLSGETEYPHLHFSVRKNGERIDPFDGTPSDIACNADENTKSLWSPAIDYSPMALVSASLTATPPNRKTIWNAAPKTIPSNAPSLVLTGTVFGMRAGDKWHFKITQPDGAVFFENEQSFTKDKQFHYQFGGRKRPSGGFQKGIWTGHILIERVLGRGETLYFEKETNITVE